MNEHELKILLLEIRDKYAAAVPARPHLTLPEAAAYLGVTRSHLYQLTHKRKIPFSKPGNKIIYFIRQELDEWILRGHQDADEG
jgi:excisionase family DNA binding protein